MLKACDTVGNKIQKLTGGQEEMVELTVAEEISRAEGEHESEEAAGC